MRLAIITLAAVASVGRAQASADTTPPSPPPGRLVDVGGWRIHLNCSGAPNEHRPTVILEAGIGDFSVEWGLVQPGAASFARVCSYDRAGDGWSELGPHPRTMRQIVYELHTLLASAGERPPYVLVGHSYGGLLTRLYQSTYRADVVGMVLIEAGADNPARMLGDGRLVHASDLATGNPVPPVQSANPLRERDIPAAALSQMKAAAAQASANANPGTRTKLPPDAQRMRSWTLSRWQHVAAAVNPNESDELMAMRAERVRTEHSLGDLPLVVMTGGISEDAALEGEHRKDQAALTAMSRRGEQVIAAQSGHHLQLDEPSLVVAAIRRVVEADAQAPSCDLLTAALGAVEADSASMVLIDHTVMGVPMFAFNAFSSIQRGDTALARLAEQPLRQLNATRVPVPACLSKERGWTLVSDSVLFTLFSATGGRWTGFRERYPKTSGFALISQPIIRGDTAMIYVAVASGKLAGRGVILRLMRGASGKWVKQSEVQLWVS